MKEKLKKHRIKTQNEYINIKAKASSWYFWQYDFGCYKDKRKYRV